LYAEYVSETVYNNIVGYADKIHFGGSRKALRRIKKNVNGVGRKKAI
jgi:hypothetical protein